MRNPNSTGTVFKLKGKRRRPWVARVTTGWQTAIAEKGKRVGQEYAKPVFFVIGYFEKKTEAEAALSAYLENPTPRANMTVQDVYNEWSAIKYPRVSSHTVKSYKTAWKHIEHLSKHRFADLRTHHWQSAIDNSNVGKSAQAKIVTIANMLYKYAIRNDIVNKNYALYLDTVKEEKKVTEIFTDIEIKKLRDNLDVYGSDTILFLIYTGFRVSEMLALTKFQVDLNSGIIRGGMKTDAGKNRIVPIHKNIMPIVANMMKSDSDYLIHRKGESVTSDYYRNWIYTKTLKGLSIKYRPPHTCRHTCATLMARAGIDNLYIQRIMGHSRYSFTADVYTHPQTTELIEAMSKLK